MYALKLEFEVLDIFLEIKQSSVNIKDDGNLFLMINRKLTTPSCNHISGYYVPHSIFYTNDKL